nr:NUDIX domain-containing protein [Aureimonas fodinaquatilis]
MLQRLLHLSFLTTRPMTLGTRIAAFDASGQIYLVRHTYYPGWCLPGGGIDAGEAAEQAARREMAEEGNLLCDGSMELIGIYFNRAASRRDHVLMFRADNVRQSAPHMGDREIAEGGFFALHELPEDTTPATRRRLAELESPGLRDAFW